MARPDPTAGESRLGEATQPTPSEIDNRPSLFPPLMAPVQRLSLFWRTFFMLAALIAGSSLAWLKTFQVLEFEPRALQTAHQIASMVNVTRATLMRIDGNTRTELLKTLASYEGLTVRPRLDMDQVAPTYTDDLTRRIAQEVRARTGLSTMLSPRVNDEEGLWVSFDVGTTPYWLRIDPAQVSPPGGYTWLIWLVVALLLSLSGAAVLARLINKPIRQLWLAASRISEGDYDSSYLDETATTSEIREVNIGFNRMASRLAKMDQDRAVMLAGISHDLRTPLARLRLETELYVADENARAHMDNDIEQLDRTIDKFLEYARPVPTQFQPVRLREVIESCLYALSSPRDMRVTVDLSKELTVFGDATELSRVFSNLLENARRYGKSASTGIANVEITGRQRDHWVMVRVRDRGTGVAPDLLPMLTHPFFRGNTARTSAAGAGLGLSIVEKTIQRMGGTVTITNPRSGGLAVSLRLNKAH